MGRQLCVQNFIMCCTLRSKWKDLADTLIAGHANASIRCTRPEQHPIGATLPTSPKAYLHLATEDLNQSHPAAKLGVRLLGTIQSKSKDGDKVASTSSQMEIKCVTYVAGQFIFLSDDVACKLVTFTETKNTFSAEAEMYQKKSNKGAGNLIHWQTAGHAHACLAAKVLEATKSPMYFRRNDDNTVALLL